MGPGPGGRRGKMDGVAHIDVSGIDYFLSDGTQLLNGVTFKVPDLSLIHI